VTAYVASPGCTAEDRALIEQLLEPLGTVEALSAERLMDVVTAVSGSGPAYVFLLAEVLAAAAEQEGLDKETAMRLASQTVAGAGALMLETGETPGALRKQVTSPGGTTEAALDVLTSADGLAPLLRRAVSAAAQRSRDLGKR
jgi:pyrroline-5-carboxylate reductase